MNPKHRKTYDALFATPTSRNIAFRDLSALPAALGCTIRQKEGSRVDFACERGILRLHEPHPGKEIKWYQVKMAQEFLKDIGVKP